MVRTGIPGYDGSDQDSGGTDGGDTVDAGTVNIADALDDSGSGGSSTPERGPSTNSPTPNSRQSGGGAIDDGGGSPDPTPDTSRDSSGRNPQRGPSGEPNSRQSGGGTLTDQGLGQADALNEQVPDEQPAQRGSSRNPQRGPSGNPNSRQSGGGTLTDQGLGQADALNEQVAADRRTTNRRRGNQDRGRIDRFVEEQLQPASESFRENIAEPIGEASATVSPVAQTADAATGTDRFTDSRADFVSSGVNALNVPAALAGGLRVGQRVGTDAGRVVSGEGDEVVDDLANDATAAAFGLVDSAQSDPLGTVSTIGGAAIGGFGVGTATARGARAAGSAARQFDGPDLGDFRRDSRAQLGTGRRSSSDSSVEQETIEIEETIGGQEARSTDIEDVPGVSIQNDIPVREQIQIQRTAQRLADEPEPEPRQLMTARERAEERLPPADEFESAATRQRELEELTQRIESDTDTRTFADVENDIQALGDQDAAATLSATQTAAAASAGVGAFGQASALADADDAAATTTAIVSASDSLSAEPFADTQQLIGAQATGAADSVAATDTITTSVSDQVADTLADTTSASLSDTATATQATATSALQTLEPTRSTTRTRFEESSQNDDDVFGFNTQSNEDTFGTGFLTAEQAFGELNQ
jgi:hypothetical protein